MKDRLVQLRRRRERQKSANRRPRRARLSPSARSQILDKTDGRCHICGGEIIGKWAADHVRAHSAGGQHAVDNYLPAHYTCNNYRWDYLPEEFELILKLGVWARTQVERGTAVGAAIEEEFTKYEAKRIRRRKAK
jgi:hypothetical protein